jgi:hypothetical protein
MTSKTALQTAADVLVIRDAAGDHYVLTVEVLDQSRATEEQHTALAHGWDGDGFGLIFNRLCDRLPFEVVGVVALPLPAARRENPFWPGIFE